MSERVWVKRYPEGIPAEMSSERPENLVKLYQESFKSFGSKEAFENMGKSITYHELDQMSDFFAAYLQNKLGMKKGDRIAIQMPNCLQYPIVLIGALKAGWAAVNCLSRQGHTFAQLAPLHLRQNVAVAAVIYFLVEQSSIP